MGDIVSLVEYQKSRGVTPSRSPYSTYAATDEQVSNAAEFASTLLAKEFDNSGRLPYAVLIGYEDKKGKTRLLKQFCVYSSRETFEREAGRNGMLALAVVRKM